MNHKQENVPASVAQRYLQQRRETADGKNISQEFTNVEDAMKYLDSFVIPSTQDAD